MKKIIFDKHKIYMFKANSIKITLCLISIILVMQSCVKPGSSVLIGELNTTIDTADVEMIKAIEQARSNIGKFNNALNSSEGDFFSLKVKSDSTKQVWLYNAILMPTGVYMGELSNGTPGTQFNTELVEIPLSAICDWMYIEDKKLVGGYTIRLQYKRMTDEERKTFDKKNALIIE